jgi:hypothetical protein
MQRIAMPNILKNVARIENAQIEWGTDVLLSDNATKYDFQEEFLNSSTVVIVNRTDANTDKALPVTTADINSFTIDRNNDGDNVQNFNWIAINQGTGQVQNEGYSVVKSSDGNQLSLIQWGSCQLTQSQQSFNFHKDFSNECNAVITTRKTAGSTDIYPVVEIDKSSFKIYKDSSVNNGDFFWIAVGDCIISSQSCFEFDLGQGYMLKGGTASSTTDNAQQFFFENMGLSKFNIECTAVLTNRVANQAQVYLPVTGMAVDCFTITRDESVKDGDFFWLALGKN